MNAKDIMTSPVITVTPDTPVRAIATLLFEHHISAVPVVHEGRLVGIVSEADLLHRHEIGTESAAHPASWWQRLLSADHSIEEYIKSHAGKARDLMTHEVVTVAPDTPVAKVAAVLEEHGVKRVPVMDGERLAGIISRSNLVQALAAAALMAKPTGPVSDETIRTRLLAELESQPWWRQGASSVWVSGGVVTFLGVIDSPHERDAARIAAENIPGVRRVEDDRLLVRDLPSLV